MVAYVHLFSWLQFIYGDRAAPTNPIENRRHMVTLNHSTNLKEDLTALMSYHLTKCTNHGTITTSPSANTLATASTSTDSIPRTVNFSDEPRHQANNENTDAVVIQPNNGSSDNLVQRETTFPINVADFNSASIRFQFFVSIDELYLFANLSPFYLLY